MPYLQKEDTKIYYSMNLATNEQAETIVFIHTNLTDHSIFEKMLPYFQKNFHTVCYDLRGFGLSGRKKERDVSPSLLNSSDFQGMEKQTNEVEMVPYSQTLSDSQGLSKQDLTPSFQTLSDSQELSNQAPRAEEEISLDLCVEDLAFLIDALHLKQVHLVGFGYGGLIALRYSISNSDRVKNMILITMACFPKEMYGAVKEHRNQISKKGTVIPIEMILKKVTNAQEGDAEYNRLHSMMSRVPPATYSKVMDQTLYTNPIPYMQQTKKSTLILAGEREIVFPQNYLSLQANILPHFQYTVIPNASSFLMVDQPEITAKVIKEFLSDEKSERYLEDTVANEIYENMQTYTEHVTDELKKKRPKKNQIQVDFLNAFTVTINGERIYKGWNQRYAKRIFIYLIFHPSTTREQLCEKVWPETPLPIARKNLRVYLSHLNKLINPYSLGKSIIKVDRENIYINGDIHSDALTLISHIYEAIHEKEAITKLDFIQTILNQLTTPDYLTVILDDWFLEIRNRIEHDIEQLIVWLAEYLIDLGKINTAIDQLKTALTLLDRNERIYDLLMETDKQHTEYWMKEKEKAWG